ncbi:MAG TPA: FxsA family protein [Acidimicrobiia bacterium]|nr:FxsA family protein [Acidimicrobiia bacterium]
MALPLLAILFIVVPLAELYVILQVGQAIGVLDTIGLLILISVVGAWLAKREGIGVLRRIQRSIEAGRVPGTELIDAFLILLAGALMLTPGFLTDILAILLLLPPVRVVVRRQLRRVFARRIEIL